MEKFILLSGRPGAGKIELILHYCNKYPETTLLLAAKYSEKYIPGEATICRIGELLSL